VLSAEEARARFDRYGQNEFASEKIRAMVEEFLREFQERKSCQAVNEAQSYKQHITGRKLWEMGWRSAQMPVQHCSVHSVHDAECEAVIAIS
jgi:hypothetical protein